MADFRTHVTFSSAIGAGYAVVGSGLGFDLSTSLVAGGLCGVSGMLPDVDSDSGIPRREAMSFAAAIAPMLLMDRFREFDLAHDQVVLLAAGMYFGVRFLGANLIGRFSTHRGMWHSIPAVLIFAGLAFLASSPTNVFDRYLKAIAVGLGSLSHLLLDEIYSVDTRGVVPRLKKSFGTAIKLWGKDPWANFSTYTKLAVVTLAVLMEPMVVERLELRDPAFAERMRIAADRVEGARQRLAQARSDAAPPGDRVIKENPRFPLPTAAPARSTTPVAPLRPEWFAPPPARDAAFAPSRSDTQR
ncbi:metal-dependent hydrolase [Botrimarina sp.]|uniref:metal-dependent hydrolase n=1 Tax=Botrimarina sp. TaxID=2795802 RepID=UPI0032EC6642